MRRIIAWIVLVLGLVAGPVATAHAATPVTTTVTLTGTLSSGRDYAGYFGPWGRNLAGKAFTATYTVTTFANSSVSAVAGMDLLSLTSSNISGPTTISYGVTINNRSVTGTANSFGMVETEDGVDGVFGGGFDRVHVAALQTTTSGSYTTTFDMSATIESFLNDFVDDRSLNAIPSFTHTVAAGDYMTGRFQVSQTQSPTILSYGVMAIHQISVASTPEYFMPSPVPEPGEWAMMAAGLAVIGAVARRRR